jgi:beta-glucosidase
MHQQSFVTRRNRYLLGWAPFVALGLVSLASSCTGLQSFPGSIGAASGSVAGSGSSAPAGSGSGSGSTASDASASAMSGSTGGSTGPSGSCIATATMIATNLTNAMALMHGEASNCPGPPNLTDIFTTPGVPMEAKGIRFRDGPRGVCLAANLPPGKAGYSTVFPSASARGATFDIALEQMIGEDIGDEVVASGHTLILAPVINILRHPAWGRAQETYGEDSYLLGSLGTAFVKGAQEYVPACAKHYAANNIEKGRQTNTSVMDEQTLHEIYGRHFEMVVQDAGVACIMASYNLVESTDGPDKIAHHSTQSPELLTTMLRDTFGFKGFVITDWWALPGDNAACSASQGAQAQYSTEAVNAGLDLEMPWDSNFTQLQNDLNGNQITAQEIATAATDIAATQCQFNILDPDTGNGLKAAVTTQDQTTDNILGNTTHIQHARQAATEGMVLLKNAMSGGAPTLPIPSTVATIAVLGATVPFALTSTDISNGTVNFINSVMTGITPITHLTGDLGSSRVYSDPTTFVGPLLGLQNGAPMGTTIVSGSSPTSLVDSTGAAYTGGVDFYVVVAGDTPEDEGEDYTGASDRVSFSLDDKNVHVQGLAPVQDPLIEAVAALGKPMVVVLEGGSVIDMPWLSTVPAVVMAWYPGQDGGDALADLLFGKVNFSGKLPVTWPNPLTGGCTEQTCQDLTGPCEACFGDEPLFTSGESRPTNMGYYIGYRYYDENKITPLFAFGHGLSYSTYAYGTPTLSAATAKATDTVTITVPVTNMGTLAGDETSFVFVSYPNTTRTGYKNVKELKAYTRTPIPVGATPTMVTIPLRIADLKYWDTPSSKWVIETGAINVMVGGSSDSLLPPVTLTLQ